MSLRLLLSAVTILSVSALMPKIALADERCALPGRFVDLYFLPAVENKRVFTLLPQVLVDSMDLVKGDASVPDEFNVDEGIIKLTLDSLSTRFTFRLRTLPEKVEIARQAATMGTLDLGCAESPKSILSEALEYGKYEGRDAQIDRKPFTFELDEDRCLFTTNLERPGKARRKSKAEIVVDGKTITVNSAGGVKLK